MSSDADYAAFLEKANQDTGPAEAQGASTKSYGTKSVDTAVPKALEQFDSYLTSDSDEPFEAVALRFEGSRLSAGDLKTRLGGEYEVKELAQDGLGKQYKHVVDAVRKVAKGDIHVFRVELDGTRAEYYVVTVDAEEGRILGLKALSVET